MHFFTQYPITYLTRVTIIEYIIFSLERVDLEEYIFYILLWGRTLNLQITTKLPLYSNGSRSLRNKVYYIMSLYNIANKLM